MIASELFIVICMKIGILTYGRVANFGANLQCASTYMYLLKHGHIPIYIYYLSKELYEKIEKNKLHNPQILAHYSFFDSIVKNRTNVCHTADDINKAICNNQIEAVIIGADAVLQHHPLISRLFIRRGILPIRKIPITSDRLFPNLFWGCGIDKHVRMVLMSVSSQNSEYKYFLPSLKVKMQKALERFCYISVRDNWTQKMIASIDSKRIIPITPDPVFAFNYNMAEYIPSKRDVLNRYQIPENYIVLSLFRQSVSKCILDELKIKFQEIKIACVILPMPDEGVNFNHSFDYVISVPFSPLDWYALIKYSQAYIGENMHPIVTCLHNAVPCYSIDNWGRVNFFNKKVHDDSSKVLHIMKSFGVESNHRMIDKGRCNVTAEEIYNGIMTFPKEQVKIKSEQFLKMYKMMMDSILEALNKDSYPPIH